MIGPAFPVAPIIGQVFKGFAYDGKAWGRAKPRSVSYWTNVQRFTASGPYVPSDNLIYCVVECIGPGGGGGWATGDLDGVTVYATAAGGGGSGGYSRATLAAELVSQGADVVIGLGGVVGLGTIGGGKTSGDASFGGLVIAYGGQDAQAFDGTGSVSGAHGTAGMGAAAGIGDVAMPGAAGGMWAALKVNLTSQHLDGMAPGLGGQMFGGAQWPPPPWIYTNQPGRDGLPNSGAGGGGAQVQGGSQATMPGGRGGGGLVVVTEYCGLNIEPEPPGPGPGWPPGVPLNLRVKATMVDENCMSPFHQCGKPSR